MLALVGKLMVVSSEDTGADGVGKWIVRAVAEQNEEQTKFMYESVTRWKGGMAWSEKKTESSITQVQRTSHSSNIFSDNRGH